MLAHPLTIEGHIPGGEQFDLALETTGSQRENTDGTIPLRDEIVELIPGTLWIGPCDPMLSEQVLDAHQRGLNFRPVRQFHVAYGMVRRLQDGHEKDDAARWDEDLLLQTAVALSRWIRPTSWGFEYACRVNPHGPSNNLQLIPAEFSEVNAHAFVEPDVQVDRLTVEDGRRLSALLQRFLAVEAELPQRIRTAIWTFEFMRRTAFLEQAWLLLAGILESLILASEERTGLQFRTRLPTLAAELGISGLDSAACTEVHKKIRSPLAHGARVKLSETKSLSHFSACTRFLSALLIRCVEDDVFAAIFEDEASIRQRLPVTIHF